MCSLGDLIRTSPQFTVLKAAAFLTSIVLVLNCAENGVFLRFHYILCPVLVRGRGHGLLAYTCSVLTFEMPEASLAPARAPLPKTEEPEQSHRQLRAGLCLLWFTLFFWRVGRVVFVHGLLANCPESDFSIRRRWREVTWSVLNSSKSLSTSCC